MSSRLSTLNDTLLHVDTFRPEDTVLLADLLDDAYPDSKMEAVEYIDEFSDAWLFFEGLRTKTTGRFVTCATVVLAIDLEGLFLCNVATASPYRGNGLATQTITRLLERADPQGNERVTLECQEKNVAFYEKMGFVDLATAEGTHLMERLPSSRAQ